LKSAGTLEEIWTKSVPAAAAAIPGQVPVPYTEVTVPDASAVKMARLAGVIVVGNLLVGE
jgi:hypothetical protein